MFIIISLVMEFGACANNRWMQSLGPRKVTGIWSVEPRVLFENPCAVNMSISIFSLDFCVTKPVPEAKPHLTE